MVATAVAISTTARLLSPLIQELIKGSKKYGARGFATWDAVTFPKKLAKKLRSIEDVKTLWSPDKTVSLLDFYYPPKISLDSIIKNISRISELQGKNYVIEGIVGQGKSIFLRSLAINEILSNEANRLPVFIEFRTLSSKNSLNQAILRQLSSYDIELDEDSLKYLQKSGRLCYLLDGFDELDEGLIKETIQEIEFLIEKYPELQIIITSRPNNEIQKSTLFSRAKISPIQQSDYTPFLSKLGLSAVKISAIKEAIRSSPSKVSGIISTPLMLTLVVIVYESEKEIPETLPEFFEKLFQVVFTRHDRLKIAFERKHHSGLSERKLQQLFEAFCFMAIESGFTRSLSTEQFQNAFKRAIEYTHDCTCEEENFRLDITKVACLMLEEGIDTTTFLHKSIMEYYAAAFIKHSSDEVADLFYSQTIEGANQWWEVLTFLRDIDPYRFSKYFATKEIIRIRDKFFNELSTRDDSKLLQQLSIFYPNLYVGLAPDPEDTETLQVRFFGSFPKGEYMTLAELDQLILRALDDTVPNPMRRIELNDLFGGFPPAIETSGIEVPVKNLLARYGSKYFWQSIDIFLTRLDAKESTAHSIIHANEKRKLIFSKPNKVNP